MKSSLYLASVFVIIGFAIVSADETKRIPERPFPCLIGAWGIQTKNIPRITELAKWSLAKMTEQSNEYQAAEISKIRDIRYVIV